MQKILLITPPFTQLNTVYPATAYIKGFLNTKNIESYQVDLGIEIFNKIFSKQGLISVFNEINKHQNHNFSENIQRIIHLKNDYIETIDKVIEFLQGKNQDLAYLICSRNFLPEASRFSQLADSEWVFGIMGNHNKAKHLASLYLEDISDLISQTIDPNFGFTRYAEQLGRSANTFDEIENMLNSKPSLTEHFLYLELKKLIEKIEPTIVAITIPFAGNMYSAFRCGQWLKKNHRKIKVVFGGGFCNTELRTLSDTRVFRYVDFITLDDGELPLLQIHEYLDKRIEINKLKRTFVSENNEVKFYNCDEISDFPVNETGTPDYSDLKLNKYISAIEIANPMLSLWSNGKWNKLSFAHGCYWAKCSFCDTSLDYIKRYEPVSVNVLCDRVEEIIGQTGNNVFHFVDEAAPPQILKEFAKEIIRRKISISWWTNIRFEKNFTIDLCKLLKLSGCIAVSGGLEVASPRILKLINKGVTVEQVTKTANNFSENGIMVHAYLMYGFPTQTEQETIDSLEVVRQLFLHGIIQSGFWHRFALTCHSEIGKNPKKFGVKLENDESYPFANNDLENYSESTETLHEKFSNGLRKSLFNFMHGICFDFRLQDWFEFKIPKTKITKNYIQQIIKNQENGDFNSKSKIIWTGNLPQLKSVTKIKNGEKMQISELVFNNKQNRFKINVKENLGVWIAEILLLISVNQESEMTYESFKKDFLFNKLGDFNMFVSSNAFKTLRENGLLII